MGLWLQPTVGNEPALATPLILHFGSDQCKIWMWAKVVGFACGQPSPLSRNRNSSVVNVFSLPAAYSLRHMPFLRLWQGSSLPFRPSVCTHHQGREFIHFFFGRDQVALGRELCPPRRVAWDNFLTDATFRRTFHRRPHRLSVASFLHTNASYRSNRRRLQFHLRPFCLSMSFPAN